MKPQDSVNTRRSVHALIKKFVVLALILAGISITVSAAGALPQLTITRPLVPGGPVPSAEEEHVLLDPGSTVVYMADGFMHVFLPDTTEQFLARENDATGIQGPGGKDLRATRVFEVASESVVRKCGNNTITITDPGRDSVLTLTDDLAPIGDLTTSGMCRFGNDGFECAVVVTADNFMITTEWK